MRSLPIVALVLLVFAAVSCGLPDPDSVFRRRGDGGTEGGPGDPVTGEPVPDAGNGKLPTGPRHENYIRGEFYPRLVIEVDAVPGKLPNLNVDTSVIQGFATVLDKPEGIVVERDGELEAKGANHVWTFAALNDLARQKFDRPVPQGTVKLHTMFVDGSYEEPSVLGIAWASRYIVLFKDRLDSACSAGLGPVSRAVCDETVRGVWTHEIGHVIGLVNNGLVMQTPHQDEAKGAHDSSDDCIMYWAYETPSVVDRIQESLLGGTTLGFDSQCLADIAAVRER